MPLAAQEPLPHRTIVIDERLAQDAGLSVGDRVVIAAEPDEPGDTVVVGAIARRGADPSEIARAEPRIRVHLTQLQDLLGYGDRVDRFAVGTPDDAIASTVGRINDAAFGFRAHRSADIAVETSETFRVVTRFHRAIGVITIVASAIFLLCILLLKVDERRRDVAALRLMGISRKTIVRMVVAEAAMIALIGSALGVVIGHAVSAAVNSYYQAHYRTPLEFSIVTVDIVLFAGVLSLVLGMAAGALAAQRLVRSAPLALLGR